MSWLTITICILYAVVAVYHFGVFWHYWSRHHWTLETTGEYDDPFDFGMSLIYATFWPVFALPYMLYSYPSSYQHGLRFK